MHGSQCSRKFQERVKLGARKKPYPKSVVPAKAGTQNAAPLGMLPPSYLPPQAEGGDTYLRGNDGKDEQKVLHHD